MAQGDSNPSLEMGASDQQALISSKRKKTIGYLAATAVMLVALGGVVALIVVFTGGESEPSVTTTTEPPTTTEDPTREPPTTTDDPDTEPPTTTDDPTTEPPTTTEDPTTEPPTTTEDPTTEPPTTTDDPDTEPPTTTDDPTTEPPTTTVDPTTEPPTTTEDPTTEPPTTTESTSEPTTPPPTLEPPVQPLDLEEFIQGAFSPSPFNGTWSTGGEMFYRDSNGDLVLYNVDTDSTTHLIANSSSQILQQSSRVMQLSADGTEVILAYNVAPVYKHSFVARYAAINTVTGHTVHITPSNIDRDTSFLQNFVWGPTGTALAFVYYNNIYYQSDLNSTSRQITTNGRLNEIYHGIPDWVYEEEIFGSNNAIWFSKDGSKMAFATFDDSEVKKMNVPHYGVPGSVDDQYTQHHEIRYPKAGTPNPTVSVTLIDVNTDARNVYTSPIINLTILKAVKFVTNSSIALVWTNRAQNDLTVQLCTAEQTPCSVVFNYAESTSWIDKFPIFFNNEGTAFIAILPQEVNGVRYQQIIEASQPTSGNAAWSPRNRVNAAHTVLEILSWNSDDVIWYKATGIEDAAEQHIYIVNSEGAVTCFTCGISRKDGGECLYNEGSLNNAGDRITINCAGPDVPQVLIFATDGSLVRVWDDSAELSSLTSDRNLPIRLRLSVPVSAELPAGADVLIQAPPDYESRNNVPLLVYVYGAPDTALVTERWSLDWGSSLVSRWGIAIAHIDGRGSGRRGASNMFALNGKLGSVEVEDQITVTKYLQDNVSWLDGNRTCIWGWSYGGYAASKALAEGGDVFRCGAAVAPITDWRFYDTIYTERYMGLLSENEENYRLSSLNTEQVAESLRDKRYFLIHGTEDNNVHYQHAMILSRRLQRQNVYFTQMSYTDEANGLEGVQLHLYHALEKFLQENML